MKQSLISIILIGAGCGVVFGQSSRTNDRQLIDESRKAIRDEIRLVKREATGPTAVATPQPSDFNDTDSFGKNVMFLGSLYAGTVFVGEITGPVNANGCPTTPPNQWAADDHCINKPHGTNTGPVQEIFDPAWQVTIPGNTIKNVIYPMLNNNISIFSDGSVIGANSVFYSPRITIVSDAFNDPLAVLPDGTPMNGSFTTSLTGSYSKSSSVTSPGSFSSENQSYASIAGRGISRSFWRALGLPESVITNFYKKPMTLKFGIRFRLGNTPDEAFFFYTFRLLGQ